MRAKAQYDVEFPKAPIRAVLQDPYGGVHKEDAAAPLRSSEDPHGGRNKRRSGNHAPADYDQPSFKKQRRGQGGKRSWKGHGKR